MGGDEDLAATMRRVRWAQGLAFGVIALALVATAAQSLLGVQRAADLATVGQGRRLLDVVRRTHAAVGPGIENEIEELVAANADFGLLCVGILRRDDVRQAGDCLETPEEMREAVAREPSVDAATHLDGRVVMIDAPPFPPPPAGARRDGTPRGALSREGRPGIGLRPDGASGDGPRPGALARPGIARDGLDRPGLRRPPRPYRGQDDPEGPGSAEAEGPGRPRGPRGDGIRPPGPRRPPPPVVIEFEPLEAAALQDSAERGAAVAFLAVVVLVVGSFVLWRLSQRAERLQERVERDRRLATLGEMASVLAHEIKNPLAGLKGHAQLLAERLPEGGSERRSADRVVGSAVRLEKLTHDLLSFVRSPRIERKDVDPAALARDAVAEVDERGFEIDVSEAPERWRLDPDRMRQVLVNLLRNAVDAGPEGRPGRVRVRVRDGRLVFGVRDFGEGVPPGEEARIFEPFHTGRVQGTGLGLAVARRIAELHGGTVTVHGPADGGAEFEVVIP